MPPRASTRERKPTSSGGTKEVEVKEAAKKSAKPASSSKPASKAKPTSEAKEKKPASAAKDKPTSKAKKPATASKATEKTAGGLPSAADFVKKAKALDLIITEKGAKDKELASFAIKPQEFGTGSYGWSGNKRMKIEVDGQVLDVQLSVNASVLKSKDAPKEGPSKAAPKKPASASKKRKVDEEKADDDAEKAAIAEDDEEDEDGDEYEDEDEE